MKSTRHSAAAWSAIAVAAFLAGSSVLAQEGYVGGEETNSPIDFDRKGAADQPGMADTERDREEDDERQARQQEAGQQADQQQAGSQSQSDQQQADQQQQAKQEQAKQQQADQQAQQGSGDAKIAQAKQSLAPHAVMIESSLKSAQQQLAGLKQGLQVADTKPSAQFVDHFKMLSKEINNDLKMANLHQAELQGAAKRFPDVARSEDLKSANVAVNELKGINKTWQSKAIKSNYWSNKSQVMNDLNRIEKQLSNAIDKTTGFSSTQLDMSAG